MADDQTPPEDALDPEADANESPDAPAEGNAGGADELDAELDDLGDLDEIADLKETPAEPEAAAPAAPAEASSDLPDGMDGLDDDDVDADEAAAAAAAAEAEGRRAAAAAAAASRQTAEPEPGDTPAPAAAGAGAAALNEVLGAAAAPVSRFAARVGEVLQVGAESVGGRKATVAVASAAVADYAALEVAFSEIPHLGLELRFAFSEVDSSGLGVLVPLPDLGRLLTTETSPSSLSDPTFRAGQLETAATAARELLDLMSLALFTDELSGAETTLADQRFDDAGTTLAHVADAGARSAPLRLDLEITLQGEATPVHCTVVVPTALLQRLAAVLAPGVAMPVDDEDFGDPLSGPAPEPTPLRRFTAAGSPRIDTLPPPPKEDRTFGLNFESSNVSAIRPGASPGRSDDVEVHPVRFPTLTETPGGERNQRALDLIMDVQMRVSVELGRSSMSVEDILALGPGSVVELNKLAGEPVDILVNEHLIARGEVVVVDENFGVRVTEIVSANRRAYAMAR